MQVDRLVSEDKIVTVPEEHITEEHCSAVFWAKQLNAKDIHKEMCPLYGRKCLLHIAVQNWVGKFSLGRLEVADDARPGRPIQTATEATSQQVEELI
jgi:hypothetical protein